MAFTNFCCRSGGSNLNAGTRLGDTTEPATSAALTYAGGSYVQSTRVFTVASGNPTSDGVAVGDYASLDTGGATAAYIARVSARSSTTITLVTSGLGTNPANGTYTLRIGGAWLGPTGTENWPFSQTLNSAGIRNAAGDVVRVNFKNDATYSVTAAVTIAGAGVAMFQGYTTAYGDLGRAILDAGGLAGVALTLFNTLITLADFVVQNTSAASTSHGVAVSSSSCMLLRVATNTIGGIGIRANAIDTLLVECEAYGCNSANAASQGGFTCTRNIVLVNCISHDNTGSNNNGFVVTGSSGNAVTFVNCIADTNGKNGFLSTSTASMFLLGCAAYNNTSSGISFSGSGESSNVTNCLLVSNGAYGIDFGSATSNANLAFNNAFWSNTSGQTNNVNATSITGSITLTGDPFTDAANGDFDLNNTAGAGAACRGAGRGAFTQTAASYTGTTSVPDVGASQHAATSVGLPWQGKIVGSIGTY